MDVDEVRTNFYLIKTKFKLLRIDMSATKKIVTIIKLSEIVFPSDLQNTNAGLSICSPIRSIHSKIEQNVRKKSSKNVNEICD